MSDVIVVGAAPSSAGYRAIAWAAQRAEDLRQPLLLYGIVGGATGAVGAATLVSEFMDETRVVLEQQADSLRARGIAVEVKVAAGDPVSLLIQESKSAALLVIGSDYRGPEGGPARGVRGIRVAAAAQCPVVVVPDIELDGAARSGVVVGVDGSPVSEAAVQFAAAEADRLNEPLIAVTAWTPLASPGRSRNYPQSYLDSMSGIAAETLGIALAGLRQDYPDLQIDARSERGYPSEVINEIASSARLTVMGTHGRGAVARFLLGSISHEVLARVAAATVIVR